MANFIISFRIASDSSYQTRYNSFVSAVHQAAGGLEHVWEETSSFFALEANETAASLCDQLYYGSDLLESKDEILVIDVSRRQWTSKGDLKYLTTLKSALGF